VKIGISEFLLLTLAVAIGGLIALAVAGTYAKAQLAATTAGNSTLSTILNLVTPSAAST
jgi:hypothetical protein